MACMLSQAYRAMINVAFVRGADMCAFITILRGIDTFLKKNTVACVFPAQGLALDCRAAYG